MGIFLHTLTPNNISVFASRNTLQCLSSDAKPTNGTLLDWYQCPTLTVLHFVLLIKACYSYIQIYPTLFHLKHHLGVANCLSLFRAQLASVSRWFAGYGNHRARLRDKAEQIVNLGVFITNPTLSTVVTTAFFLHSCYYLPIYNGKLNTPIFC